jgi:hypothetical protein
MIEPHVAQNMSGRSSAIDGRTTRHAGYAISQRLRKRIEGSKRWRYYVSQATLQGDKSKAGSVVRVPAPYLEALVAGAVRKQSPDGGALPAEVRDQIDCVTVGRTAIHIQLSEAAETEASALTVPWTPPSPYRKRGIIQGTSEGKTSARPMRASARSYSMPLPTPHRWLDEFLSDPLRTLETLALREGKTERSIRMILSLAFLAPNIVRVAGRGTPAARLRPEESCRSSDGLVRPVAGARAQASRRVDADQPFISSRYDVVRGRVSTCDFGRRLLTNSNSGNGNLRPETLAVTRQNCRPRAADRPAETSSSHIANGNVGLFWNLRNHQPFPPGTGNRYMRLSSLRGPGANQFAG